MNPRYFLVSCGLSLLDLPCRVLPSSFGCNLLYKLRSKHLSRKLGVCFVRELRRGGILPNVWSDDTDPVSGGHVFDRRSVELHDMLSGSLCDPVRFKLLPVRTRIISAEKWTARLQKLPCWKLLRDVWSHGCHWKLPARLAFSPSNCCC